ncbi:hypothetical protein MMC28_000512 [Mycoblastus sanguinarius]|nr:hypothetical protein [Mycoblastus sanguinarius]
MKTSFLSCLALTSSFTSLTFAAPTSDNTLIERATPANAPAALAIMQGLYTQVKQHTAVINSTAASLGPTSDKAAAANTFESQIASIDTLVVGATRQVNALGTPAHKRSFDLDNAVAKRTAADPTGIGAVVASLLAEIGGALDEIIAALGLTATLSFLGPLVATLSGLLAALVPVVEDLLGVVEGLLGGLLGGLSAALAGLGL